MKIIVSPIATSSLLLAAETAARIEGDTNTLQAAKDYADSLGGASNNLQIAADDNAAYALLLDGQWGIFSVSGQDPTFYAKDSSGNKFKLTLPAL